MYANFDFSSTLAMVSEHWSPEYYYGIYELIASKDSPLALTSPTSRALRSGTMFSVSTLGTHSMSLLVVVTKYTMTASVLQAP